MSVEQPNCGVKMGGGSQSHDIEEANLQAQLNSSFDWEVIHQRILRRNTVQTMPFKNIIGSNEKMFYELAILQRQQNDMKRSIALIQHETISGDASVVISKIRSKLSSIHSELSDKQNSIPFERSMRLDLSKKYRDQCQRVVDQDDELKELKEDLSESKLRIIRMETDLNDEKRSSEIMKAEIENLRRDAAAAVERAQVLENENRDLVGRILSEKEKTVDELNQMNSLVGGVRGLIGNGFSLWNNIKAAIPTVASPSAGEELHSRSSTLSATILGEVEEGPQRPLGGDTKIPSSLHCMLQCHGAPIYDVVVVDDGQHFITAGSDSTVKIFNSSTCLGSGLLSSPSATHTLANAAAVISVNVSAPRREGSEFVVAAMSDNSCRISNIKTGLSINYLTRHTGKVFSAKFVGDGSSRLVTGSLDRTVRVWDISSSHTASDVISIRPGSATTSLAISPSFTCIVSGHQDGGLRFWDIATGSSIHTMLGHHASGHHVTCLEYSPRQHTQLLTMSVDNTLTIVDTRMHESIAEFRSPKLRVACQWSRACFSPDGLHVAAGSKNGTVTVWNTLTSQIEVVLDPAPASTTAVPVAGVSWGSTLGLVACDKEGRVAVWR